MIVRHTRDNRVWLGSEVVEVADIVSVVPAYALPEGYSHFNYDSEGNEVSAIFDTACNQKPLPDGFSTTLDSVVTNVNDILAARTAREAQAVTDAETARQAAIDALPLADQKALRIQAIDAKTDELYAAGVSYTWNSTAYTFDTRSGNRAADNWSKFRDLVLLVKTGALLEANRFPCTVYTKDRQGIAFTTANDAVSFIEGLTDADLAVAASGGVLKAQIDAAADKTALDAIVDNR